MKLCNEVITVFNARWDAALGDDVYFPTVIRGASWRADQRQSVDARGGLVSADRVTVRIPEGADAGGSAFVDAAAYRNAPDASGLWTLTGGTYIVRGEAGPGDWTPGKLREAFADCMCVLGVADNRRAPRARHWRAVGT
ncbi:MAG: hypothetical protein IJ124_14170 [Clostridia bacterium]|nr:hypothetical protein [Clostridia bacterium]